MRNDLEIEILNVTFIRRALALLIFLLAFSPFYSWAKSSQKKVSYIKGTPQGYVLYVYSRPFVIRGVVYQPIPVGKNWDYDIFSHPEILKVDGPLLKKLGVNVVRFYQPGKDIDATKRFIDILYKDYGIYTIMGHWLGFWDNPNYGDPAFREYVKSSVLEMVKALKDSPGIIMWVLGNENNYSFGPENVNPWITQELLKIRDPAQRRKRQAEIYYSFVDYLAEEIKKIDPSRVVVLGNGGLRGIDVAGKICKHVDLLGLNLFTGKSFGHVWRDVANACPDRPFFVMEFGADAFDSLKKEENDEIQAEYIRCLWQEIERNLAGGTGRGNVVGGIVFEWTDEWWKSDIFDPKSWWRHDKKGDWSCGGYYHDIACEGNMNMNEEWWGIVAISRKKDENGVNLRRPRKAFYILKDLWSSSMLAQRKKERKNLRN